MLNFSLVVLLPISLTISQVTISPSTPSSIDSKHSIFSASIVDRLAFASKIGSWTQATDHIVHSIPHLTTITFVINAVADLPILETTLVTHIGTVKLIS